MCGFFSPPIKTYNLISKVTASPCVDVTVTQSIVIQLTLGNLETVIQFGLKSSKCSAFLLLSWGGVAPSGRCISEVVDWRLAV